MIFIEAQCNMRMLNPETYTQRKQQPDINKNDPAVLNISHL